MLRFEYTVTDPEGFHARPAGMFVKEAKKYDCVTTVEKNGKKAIVYVNFSNNGYIIPMTGNHVELLHNRKMSGCLDIPANSYGVYEVGENITSK